MSIDFLIYKMLLKWKNRKIFEFEYDSLFGDASGRQYFRVNFADQSCILMKMSSITSGEFGRGNAFHDFMSIDRYLADLGLDVPKILAVDETEKTLLLEDLGNLTLFDLIKDDPISKIAEIKKSIGLLIRWQHNVWNRKRYDAVCDKRTFKLKLFMDEFYHFYEYMIEKRVYTPSFKGVWKKAQRKFSKISSELAKSPYILSHRDFQSKNIMLHNDKMYIIDFQDALHAPFVYDLASLLRDSYIYLTPQELNMLIDYYYDNSSIAKEVYPIKSDFVRIFHLQTVQRKMKDAGRFIYLNQVKEKQWFIPFVSPSLEYVKNALIELEMDDLLTLLAPFIPEFSKEVIAK